LGSFAHRKKYEIATDEPHNPIKQDEKKGTLREVSPIILFFNNFVLYSESNFDLTDVYFFLHYRHSSRRATFSSTMDAFRKLGKIRPSFILMQMDAVVTTTLLMFVKSVLVSSGRV
jgi:hypothetical protein